MTLNQPTWVAAASLQDMLTADKTPACTCQDDVQKRLAHASAIARQHIALGLAPQHTRALRVLPTCATQRKASNAAMDEQTKNMAQLLQEQARQITAQQDLLQQMLHNNLRSHSPTSPPSTVCSHRPTATQTEAEPPQIAQPKDSVAAAPKCAPSRRQSSGVPAGAHSMLPWDPCQDVEPARRGVSGPVSSKSKPAEEGSAAGKQAVSVVAKPELYSALTAAVSAIVQHAGLAPCQRSDCSQGISLQYHAEGGGAQAEGQGAPGEGQGMQPQGQCAQLNGRGTQLGGQGAQAEGQTEGVGRQASRPQGQDAGHKGQHAGHEGQQQDSSSAGLATASAASPPSHMASQHSCGQAHHGHVSAHHCTSDDRQTRAQHAQHAHRAQGSTAGAVPASGQQMAGDGIQGGVAAGQAGVIAGPGNGARGSGGVEAWQAQVAQAMQVLQAALQSSCKAEEHPPVVLTRQQPPVMAQHAEHSTHALNADQQHASMVTDASWPQAWPESQQSGEQLTDNLSCKEAPVYAARAVHSQTSGHNLVQHSAASAARGLLRQQGEGGPRGAPRGVPRGGYGLSTVRGDSPSQQSCRPSRNPDNDCLDGTWQKQDCRDDMWQKHDCRDDTWQKPKGPASATQTQRRLYKHGPVVPKASAMQRPIRRRQRPEWNDHLTSVTPQTERGEAFPEEGLGGLGSRPTAKELLQEALARIQTASNSPRPQHAKRQRRGTAPQQGQPGHATHQPPQLQSGKASAGGAQLGRGHSCDTDATAAQGVDQVWNAQRQLGLAGQPDKQILVKQPAFGGKPLWVCQSSAGVVSEHSAKAGKSPTAASPQFADADKAQAWQKLTHLQQHMLGLITAVEAQLSLSDSPKSAREHHSPKSAHESRATAAAEQPADAMHSGDTPQQQQQQQQEQREASAVTSDNDQQPEGTQMLEQLQTHTVDAETSAEGRRQKPAGDGETGETPVVDKGAEAATDESPQQGQQQLCVVTVGQQTVSEVQQLPPKAGALSDGDVQRVLAHRRAYLKQQRAFDRACMGTDEAFDPTQVVESIADMLLEDVLQQCAAELGEACDSFAEELFDAEFVV